MVLKLRTWQEKALPKLANFAASAEKRGYVCAATGTGKTTLGLLFAKAAHGTVCVVAPTEAIKDQWKKAADEMGVNNLKIFLPAGSGQILLSKHVALTIFDECHHAEARTYKKVLTNLPCKVLGLTATPFRMEGSKTVSVTSLFDENCVYNHPLANAILDGDLCDLRQEWLRGEDQVLRTYSVHASEATKAKVFSDTLHYVRGHHTLAIFNTLEEARTYCEFLVKQGISAASTSTDNDRDSVIFDQFRDGEITVLCGCDKISEGFDAPIADQVLLFVNTTSLVRYAQILGRILRLHPGKEFGRLVRVSLDSQPKKGISTGHVLAYGYPETLAVHLDKCLRTMSAKEALLSFFN